MKQFGYILTLYLLLFVHPMLMAKDWTATDIPMVHLQDARRYVCDPEQLMDAAIRDSADVYAHRLEKECGIETVWVVVSNVENGDVFRVAQDIGNKAGVGNKKTDRGLVVVIAVGDRKYFIAPGEGLEGDLTDAECDDIGRACIVKNMRQGNVSLAVLSTAKAVYSKFRTGKTGIESKADADDDGVGAMIFLIALIAFWIYSVLRNGNRGGGRGGRGRTGGWGPIIWGNPGHLNDHSFGGGFSGGSFGGGSFGGGGAGGGW